MQKCSGFVFFLPSRRTREEAERVTHWPYSTPTANLCLQVIAGRFLKQTPGITTMSVMNLEAKLERCDSKTPWGFRMQGGKDFNSPLIIQNVSKVLSSSQFNPITIQQSPGRRLACKGKRT